MTGIDNRANSLMLSFYVSCHSPFPAKVQFLRDRRGRTRSMTYNCLHMPQGEAVLVVTHFVLALRCIRVREISRKGEKGGGGKRKKARWGK